jgi:hypothetical protein
LSSYIREYRTSDEPFDIVYIGNLPTGRDEALETVARYEEAGVTWWLESLGGSSGLPVEEMSGTLRGGPVRKGKT